MRISVDIDGDLLAQAIAVTGLAAETTVEQALRRLVRRHRRRAALADMTGLGWEGDLSAMREQREPDVHS